MDNCERIFEFLPNYINGNLSEPDIAIVVSHLARCRKCREEAAFLIALKKNAGQFTEDVPFEVSDSAFKKIYELQEADSLRGNTVSIAQAFKSLRQALSLSQSVVKFAYQNL